MVDYQANVPIRIADVVGGHVHPSICATHSGDLIAVYNREGGGGKELLLCRSDDGGLTWSRPHRIHGICNCSIYPGSLTSLPDGRVLLNWSCYRNRSTSPWREPQFCLSEDAGTTWTSPHNYPIVDCTEYTCMRHSVVDWSETSWVCPFYDRTVLYDAKTDSMQKFGDGRNHGMVPLVRTGTGILISGAPQKWAPVPVGVPGDRVDGLRSTDDGATWQSLEAFPHFGVAGYDLTVLGNDWVVLTYIVYGIGVDGEFGYEMVLSRDHGLTWNLTEPVEVYNPQRRIGGRGWPRTVQIDEDTLATLFYDLNSEQMGGPGLYLVRTPIAAFSEPPV